MLDKSKNDLISKFKEILGDHGVLYDKEDLENYGKDWLKDYQPSPTAILLPKNSDQIKKILLIANEKKVAIVPSGGRTGLSGGATAMNDEFVLSLTKMNKVIEINSEARYIRCEAGTITQAAQDAAKERGLFLPIEFASQGSSQIGGNISTNAGGIRVVRYGSTRDIVLGLKVITGSGEELDLNGSLIKNNTGYDLKHLFIGSEGTLGIITEATLKLSKLPKDPVRLLCGIKSLGDILKIFTEVRDSVNFLNCFEYFSRDSLEIVCKFHSLPDPLDKPYPHYLMIEVEDISPTSLEEIFSNFLDKNLISDIIISNSVDQANKILSYREKISETLSSNFTIHKNDISIPIEKTVEFLEKVEKIRLKNFSNFQLIIFGHIGDGNLHLNFIKPQNITDEQFLKELKKSDELIFECIREFSGSISAEHGIGLLKKPYLHFSRSEYEIESMKSIKKIFDPNYILNPGKIF